MLLNNAGPRRHALRTCLGVFALVLALAGCSGQGANAPSGQPSATTQSGSAKGFSYTDARDQTVRLDRTPAKIVMSEQAAAALMPYGIKPVGIWGSGEPKDSKVLAGLDTSGISVLGVAYGKIDVDKLASLEPDLVITGWYPGDYLGGLGKSDAEVSTKIAKVAPMIAVSAKKPASESLTDWRELATRLGAQVDSGAAAEAKKNYDVAVTELKSALVARPGTTAYAVAPSNLFYIAIPEEFAELRDYRAWGLDVRQSSVAKNASSGSFSPVSWENVGDYPSDLLLYDTRQELSLPLDKVRAEHPTMNTLPTIKDGRIAPWTTDATFSHGTYATQIKALTAAITKLPQR